MAQGQLSTQVKSHLTQPGVGLSAEEDESARRMGEENFR